MDTGQMIAVMQPMPVSVAVPQAGGAVVSADPLNGNFAGLMRGMTPQNAVQATAAGQGLPLGMPVPMEVPVVMSDAMTALLTIAGNSEKQAAAVQVDSAVEPDGTISLQDEPDASSQNVTPAMDGVQVALLFAQLNGRMPEVVSATNSRAESPQEPSQAVGTISASQDSTVLVQSGRDVAELHDAINAGMIASPQQDSNTVVPTGVAAPSSVTTAETPILGTPGSKVAAAPQKETAVTEGDKQAAIATAKLPHSTDVNRLVPTAGDGRQPEGSFGQARGEVKIVSEMQRRQEPLFVFNRDVVVESDVQASQVQQPPTAEVRDGVVPEEGVLSVKQPLPQGRLAVVVPSVLIPGTPQGTAQKVELSEDVVVPPAMTGQQDPLQKVRPGVQLFSQTAAVVNAAAGRPGTEPLRPDQRETVTKPQGEKIDAVKIIAEATFVEMQTNSNEQGAPDQGMNGNFQPHVPHQQIKSENLQAISNASGDTSRAALPPDPVVQQVRDRFANHETKPGSEQIVLRLSPEHLGELKVNLNLEGQRLKVEIVAENKVVRDSLMQHTDALKESLSRQNIKMESFDVTTGGNSTADGGRNQGDWRELAQQRQQNAWMPDGGYRLARQAAPAMAAYQAKSEHAMVDLHF